jgi:hypothetical protein
MTVGPTVDREARPATGSFRYNTDIKSGVGAIEVFDGTKWSYLSSGGVTPVVKDTFIGIAPVNFTGTLTGTGLTVTVAPTVGAIAAGMDIGGTGVLANTKIVSGSGTTWVVDTTYASPGVTGILTATLSTFTMSRAVVADTDVVVFIGNIYQNPGVAYTVDGSTTITFTSPPPQKNTIVVLHGLNGSSI